MMGGGVDLIRDSLYSIYTPINTDMILGSRQRSKYLNTLRRITVVEEALNL